MGDSFPNKFNARRVEWNGIHFRSMLELNYAKELELRRYAENPTERVEAWEYEITFWIPTIHRKPRYVKHIVDFWVRWASGCDQLVEVKGRDTPAGRVKRLWLESYLGEPITVRWG